VPWRRDSFGYNTPGLYPFYYKPLYAANYVSRDAAGDASINAYNVYGMYGLLAASSIAYPSFGTANMGCSGGGAICAGGGGGGGGAACGGGGVGC
jgi:hypothetical protein